MQIYFMERLERKLLSRAQVRPHVWLRYIDDIFMVWTRGEDELKTLLNYLNNAHDTIKFAWDCSTEHINYNIDVLI